MTERCWRRAAALWLAVVSSVGTWTTATGADRLPAWFEQNRVQAHFENRIHDDLDGLYQQLHPAVRSMGARVLTRIFKTTGEGAWWPTAVGETNELLRGRDLGRELVEHAHQCGLRVFAYYRIMCDDFVEREHPEWLCRDVHGELVLEPRTRRRPNPRDRRHVICFNSPARQFVQARLLELADRGVDGIYFDSWHMPEVCTCENCRRLFQQQTGRPLRVPADRSSPDYQRAAAFVAQSIVRNFRQWKAAVRAKHPDVLFAIGSSLYPCFHTQMQLTADLLAISDTSKTEFSKPFGGFLGWPVVDGRLVRGRLPRHLDPSFALPSYDVQNALGWTFTRDSCDGRPPLMWVPFTRTEQQALFSAAAAVTYGCVASIHPTDLWSRRTRRINPAAIERYRPVYAYGQKVSPHLAGTRPLRWALLHISERSRNRRIADQRKLWVEFFAPLLAAFETFQQAHWPVATINDRQLAAGVPDQAAVLVLTHRDELDQPQRRAVERFTRRGGVVVCLDDWTGWHLRGEKETLKRKLLEGLEDRGLVPPIRVRGPARLHAVFFRGPEGRKTVVSLVNDFGWFRCKREPDRQALSLPAPPPCEGVVVELQRQQGPVRRAVEAVTGKELEVSHEGPWTRVAAPPFAVTACVVLQ